MSETESNQLVTVADGDYENEKKDPKVPIYAAIILILLLIGLGVAVYVIDDILPTPLTIADEEEHHYDFIAESAREYLKGLMQFGPRVQGSTANEVLAVQYLLEKIESIKEHAYFNKKFDIDLQVVSGAYKFYKPGVINSYGNIQNIVVKLYNEHKSKESVLVNVHFDTVPVSPGGSDDGINCAVALEVLRKLSRFSESFQNNFIFLFNGAEETPLQAAHAFITKHKWAKEVKVVINLEAAGAGGKSMLFQAGPKKPWLLDYYKKVPYPNGNVASEELFLTGIVKSDTDFRTFRNFGNLTGLDFAFIDDGYRYHTSYDGFDNIPNGSYQHVGTNTLSLMGNLGNAKELTNVEEQPTKGVIYYSCLSLFFISYTQTVAVVLHSVFVILSLIIIGKSFYDFKLGCNKKSSLYLGATLGAIILGWLLSVCCVLLIGVILDAVNFSMSWFANPWILFGLYVTPIVLCSSGLIVLLNKFNPFKLDHLTSSAHAQIQALFVLLILIIILLIVTILGVRSAYLVFLPVLFQSVALGIINLFHLQERLKIWPFIYVAATVLPNMLLIQFSERAIEFIIPIAGRSGDESNPEILIGLLTALSTFLTISFYIPLVTIVRKSFIILLGLFAVFILFLIFVFTPIGFPYSGDVDSPRPQRFWTYHANRVFRNDINDVYKIDSGYFLLHQDRNSPHSVEEYVKELADAVSIEDDCRRSIYCGLPIGRNMIDNPEKSIWIPTESPTFTHPINLVLNSKTTISKNVIRYKFTAIGPDHMEIYISPKTNVNVTKIDLVRELPTPRIWNDRPLYIIMYGWGKQKTPLVFSVDIQVLESHIQTTATFDIALVGRYMHSDNIIISRGYRKFLNQFPVWTDIMPMLSAYESWVY